MYDCVVAYFIMLFLLNKPINSTELIRFDIAIINIYLSIFQVNHIFHDMI